MFRQEILQACFACQPKPEYDIAILCDPVTDARVIVTSFFDPGTPPVVEAFNLDGTAYGGSVTALVNCPDVDAESDAVAFCANGVSVLQHLVKSNGVPTGDVFWTDQNGSVIPAPVNPIAGPCATGETVSISEIIGRDLDTPGSCVVRRTTILDDGTVAVTYHNLDGTPYTMTNSASFSPGKEVVENEQRMIHITNTGAGQAEYGRVHLVKEVSVFRDGVIDPAATTYWNTALVPNIDVTADVAALVAAGSQIDVAPVRKQLPEGGAFPAQTQTITGGSAAPLASIPQFATYAEIYIEAGAGDAGLRWTKDGSAPTDGAANEQEQTGTTIRLLDRDEIDGFRASVIDLSTGDIDPAGTAIFKAVYWNVAPDED